MPLIWQCTCVAEAGASEWNFEALSGLTDAFKMVRSELRNILSSPRSPPSKRLGTWLWIGKPSQLAKTEASPLSGNRERFFLSSILSYPANLN